MATTEPGTATPASADEVGRQLRAVRKAKGLSRAEVARSAGLTRRELSNYERGRTPVPESDLWCLAGSCGVDVDELLPTRDRLGVGGDLGTLSVGDSVRRLRAGIGIDGVLREYVALISELRNLPPGSKPPMREEDLAALADALGGTPEAIEARLHELVGASRDEAARLRSLILPPRSLPAASAPVAAPTAPPAPTAAAPSEVPAMAGATPGEGSVLPELTGFDGPTAAPLTPGVAAPAAPPAPLAEAPAYPPATFDFAPASPMIGDPAAADRFFDAPRGDDPFAAPPPFEILEPLASLPAALPPTFDPFAPPTVPPIDPFGPPTGPPFAAAPGAPALGAPTDAWGAPGSFEPPTPFESSPPGPRAADLDTFVVDFGDDSAPEGPSADPWAAHDPFAAVDVTPVDTGSGPMETASTDAEDDDPVQAMAPLDGTTDDDLPELDPDDPFAILRVPIDELEDDSFALAEQFGADPAADLWTDADPFGPESRAVEVVFEAVDLDPPIDPFAGAFEPLDAVLEPLDPLPETTEATDETNEALAPEEVVATGEVIEVPEAAEAAEVAEVPEVPDVSAVEPVDAGPELLDAPTPFDVADPSAEPTDEWFDRAAAAADALIAGHRHDHVDDAVVEDAVETVEVVDAPPDAIAALAPIAWSLDAPPATADADAHIDEWIAAGSDWEVGGIFPATAMADDGTLALRRADVRWALADVVAEEDFAARAMVNFTSGAGFGILFRVSVDDRERITGYSFDVDPIYSGGGFLLRQWNDSKQHWKPLAHAPVADSTRLYGPHTIEVRVRADQLVATVDGDVVLTVDHLSRCSIDSGREPCRGGRLGVQAWSTTEVTVDRLLLANG